MHTKISDDLQSTFQFILPLFPKICDGTSISAAQRRYAVTLVVAVAVSGLIPYLNKELLSDCGIRERLVIEMKIRVEVARE